MEDSKRFHKFYGRPGEDFELWAARTEAALQAQEVLDVVVQDYVGDDGQASDDETMLRVAKARAIIMQGLDAKPLRVCLAFKSNPYKMWDCLRKRYAVSNVATQVQLQTKLNRLMYEDQTMSDFIDSFEEIFNRLEGMGSPFPEQMQVALLLSSFGQKSSSKYGSVVAALQTLTDSLTWEHVTARLLQEYEEQQWNSKQASSSTDTHALTAGAARFRHHQSDRRTGRETRSCFSCGRVGHLSRDCRKKAEPWKPRAVSIRTSQRVNERRQGQANVAKLLIAKTGRTAVDGSLILDSGASEHMVKSRAVMQNIRPIQEKAIILGNGNTVVSNRAGEVVVDSLIGHNDEAYHANVRLRDVLLVPDLNTNLVSCSKLCDAGYKVTFGRFGCAVSTEEGNIIMSARMRNGIYEVHGSAIANSAAYSAQVVDEDLWHARFGHANKQSVRRLLMSDAVQSFKAKSSHQLHKDGCEACAKGKHCRAVRHTNYFRATRVGETVHSDVCGPMTRKSLGGAQYYVSFIDEMSGYIMVVPIKKKSDVAARFKSYMVWLERRAECSLKRLHSDNGGEYIALEDFLEEQGIEYTRSSPYAPQENGIAERCNRTIVESTRAMLTHAGLPLSFWAEAAVHAADLRNRFFCPRDGKVTSFELVTGRKPRVDHLRIFGSHAWVHIPTQRRRKLEDKSEEGLIIGCRENSQYKIWLRHRKEAVFSRDVKIDENRFPGFEWFNDEEQVLLPSVPTPSETRVIGLRLPTVPSAEEQQTVGGSADEAPENEDAIEEDNEEALTHYPPENQDAVLAEEPKSSSDQEHTASRYPQRQRSQPNYYDPSKANVASVHTACEPTTVHEALSGEEGDQWRAAINSEVSSLEGHGTWTVARRRADKKALPVRFVFKRKVNPSGGPCRYKARLVVKGYMQGDIENTFAPVVDFNSVRVCLALAVQKGHCIHQMDVKTAFLHGTIDDEVYIEPPEGLEICRRNEVLKLNKGLYGLKQSPRLWNEKWKEVVSCMGFRSLQSDECIFMKGATWILLYVDDILIISPSLADVQSVKKQLASKLDVVDMGPLSTFLGVTFVRCKHEAFLSQEQYISSVLSRFGMSNCKPVSTPMCTSSSHSNLDTPHADSKRYQEMMGSLLFLATRTRPDISAAVSLLCRHTANPRAAHFVAGKRVLRYLQGTKSFALRIGSTQDSLVAYADADWANDHRDRRSTSGILLQLAGGSVLWKTCKQSVVALSTCEAELMAASEVCKGVVWVRHLLCELGFPQEHPTTLYEDNQGAQVWGTYGVRNAKHVAIRRNYVKEQVDSRTVEMKYVPSADMKADVLTKALGRVAFEKHRVGLGLMELADA